MAICYILYQDQTLHYSLCRGSLRRMSENPKSGRSWPICRAWRTVTSDPFFCQAVKPTRTFCPGQSFAIGPRDPSTPVAGMVGHKSWPQWLHPQWQLKAGQSSPWPLPVRVLLDTSLLTRTMSSSSSSSNSSYNWVFLCSAYRARIHSTTRGPSWPSMALTMRYVYLKCKKHWNLLVPRTTNITGHQSFSCSKFLRILRGPGTTLQTTGLCQKQRHKPFQYTSFWGVIPNLPAVGFKLLSSKHSADPRLASQTCLHPFSRRFWSSI